MPRRRSLNSFLQHVLDLFADGVQLAAAGAGDQHEVIEDRRQFSQIENRDVPPAVEIGDAGGRQGALEAAIFLPAEIRDGTSDSQRILFLTVPIESLVGEPTLFYSPPGRKRRGRWPGRIRRAEKAGRFATTCPPAADGYRGRPTAPVFSQENRPDG